MLETTPPAAGGSEPLTGTGGGATRALPPEIARYYEAGGEAGRLLRGHGPLELVRTKEIILRHLSPPPRSILDVGGGPGIYACWLASLGHTVHLVDAMPLHVEQAREASARQPGHPLASVGLGDARQLRHGDGCVDVVLLLGPLYHLVERDDRIAALREAHRVLRPGGFLLAAAVARFASLLTGIFEALLDDPDARRIVEQDLRDGQHRNPTSRPYFTTAFFHHPAELVAEIREVGLELLDLLGVEGPGWCLPDLETRWRDPFWRERLLDAARAVEREPTLLGMNAHVLAVARRGA